MKKIIKILFSTLCAVVAFGAFASCGKGGEQFGNPVEIEKTATLSLNKTHAVLHPGDLLTLTAALENVAEADAQPFEWKSYDTQVATVDNGVVTAVSFGTTYVSVNSGTLNASCKITVQAEDASVHKSTLEISATNLRLNAFYDDAKSSTLSVIAYQNGEAVAADVVWESENEDYVTVENGVVTALKNGATTKVYARATVGGVNVSAVCYVVTEDEVVLTLTPYTGALEPNEEYKVPVSLTVNGSASTQTPVWTTSDSSVAAVEDGTVRGVSGGKATITATYGNQTKSFEVIVKTYVRVRTAEQFLSIGKGDEHFVYVLENNVDLGAYLSQNPWLNDE
ncbi:MAG: Ig-like domain-containing protein, partial [Clostridia bacterium]|nr:Ig-like domain-containing protein [Clostridia bacterium]